MTDRTPHEGLEMDVGGYRQFFRVVEGDVGVWFEEHSTVNKVSGFVEFFLRRVY